MKSKANTIVIAFILSALVLSICGCPGPGQTAGPGLEQTTNGESKAVAFLKGRELGRKHRNEQLRTYRLLIALVKSYPTSSPTHEADRSEFLRGFGEAYADANVDTAERAKRVEDLLRKSLPLEDSIYRRLLEQGGMHEKGQMSNTQIANIIQRYIDSPEREIACKAGYIEGYVQAHSSFDKEDLYVDALWMYIAVRPSMNL